MGFSTGPTGPGHPSGRGSRRGQALKLLYLGDYWELVRQTVHGEVSAQPSPVVGNVSGALRGAWSLPRKNHCFLAKNHCFFPKIDILRLLGASTFETFCATVCDCHLQSINGWRPLLIGHAVLQNHTGRSKVSFKGGDPCRTHVLYANSTGMTSAVDLWVETPSEWACRSSMPFR